MTRSQREAAIADELSRADDALRAAEALAAMGLLLDAASRLYYAVYHATLALLLTEDLEPTTHHGVVSLLGLHFVKTGKVPAEMSTTLRRIQGYREAADYTRGFVLVPDDSRRDFDAARAYLRTVRDYLAATS